MVRVLALKHHPGVEVILTVTETRTGVHPRLGFPQLTFCSLSIVGASDGSLKYYLNTGTASSPVFTEQTGSSNPFFGTNVGGGASPWCGDMDADGDSDWYV